MIENKRLAFKMATYEWSMALEALDAYIEKYEDMIDCSALLFMAEQIEKELEL
jgi:hypothetical protein